jgi:twitching motility protein PilJ
MAIKTESDVPLSISISRKTSRQGLSLRWKVTLLTVLIGVLPVGVVGSIAYFLTNRTLEANTYQEKEVQIITLMDSVERFLVERYADIQVIANSALLRNQDLRASLPLSEQIKELTVYKQAYGVYDTISFIDLNGKDIISLEDSEESENHPHRDNDYFKTVVQTGNRFISQPRFDQKSGQVVIYFSAPVRDSKTNALTGVVQARMPVAFLQDLLQKFDIEGSSYYLVNQNGEVFVTNRDAQALSFTVAGETFESAENTVFSAKMGEMSKAIDFFPAYPDLQARSQPGSVDFRLPGGNDFLASYAPYDPILGLPNLKWGAFLLTETRTAFAIQFQLAQLLLIGSGVVSVVVALIGVLLANQVVRPVLDAAQTVKKIGQGNLDVRVMVSGSDELAILGYTINQMAGRLKVSLDQLRDYSTELEIQKEEVEQSSLLLQQDVGHILDVVSGIESGDLTIQANVNDRMTGLVSDTLNRLIEQLAQVLSQVAQTALQVSAGSLTLGDLAKTVAANADRQAAGVTDILTLMANVEQATSLSTAKIQDIQQALVKVKTALVQGQQTLTGMTQGITTLRQGTDRTIQRMKVLGEFVGLADRFVQEQGQIAAMTQVLALNASLVAARATEQRDPRQFAVVAREFESIADQVGSLAQQTNEALNTLQNQTEQIHLVVAGIDSDIQSLGSLVGGFTLGVDQSAQVFAEVQTLAQEVLEAGEGVTQSGQAIHLATQDTTEAVRAIADLANQTAQLTQSAQQQSEALETLSRQLLQAIQFFQLPNAQLASSDSEDKSLLPDPDPKESKPTPSLSLV